MSGTERKPDEPVAADASCVTGADTEPVGERDVDAAVRPPVDRRGKLGEEPFDVQVTRDKVLVRFRGRLVRTLVGADADEVRAAHARSDVASVQLLVARKTGNFKRGNER